MREPVVTWPEYTRLKSPKRKREREPAREVLHLHAAVALVLGGRVRGVGLAVRFLLGHLAVDDRIAREAFTEVHVGLGQRERRPARECR